MTTAAPETGTAQVPQQQQPPPADRDVVAAVAVALAGAATLAAAAAALLPLLLPFGLPRTAVLTVVSWVWHVPPTPARPAATAAHPVTSAARQNARAAWAYRAAYLVAAARRIGGAAARARADGEPVDQAVADALRAERRYFAQHRQADRMRRAAAAAADTAAARYGPTLGWRAVLDEHTSPECRAADGGIFTVAAPPVIGWPGSVHPSCRCRPTAPRRGARTVNQQLAAAGLR